MICGTFTIQGVPAADVLTRENLWKATTPPPNSVNATQQPDGTYTIVIAYDPCPADTTHAESAAGAATGAATSAPASGVSSFRKGFDADRDCGTLISKIVAAKVDFVVRYYSHSGSKNLSSSEAKLLSIAGVNIVTVWESAGDHAEFFTRSQGVDDATSAHNMAIAIGQPAGTPIYFAVDFDATQVELNARIIPYFQGVAAGMSTISSGSPPYTAGVYGSGLVCSSLFGLGLVTHTWLSMSTGFAGSKTYNDWNIRQHLEADPFGFGFKVDPDEAKDGYGGFKAISTG